MIALDTVPIGPHAPDEINLVVTQPAGSAPLAVEVDPLSGLATVARLYQSAMISPGTFGLIPQTRSERGQPLAAFLPVDASLPAGLAIACRPVGVVYVTSAEADVVTVLAVPLGRVTARFDKVRSYTDIGAPALRQLSHYLTHAQDLEDDQLPRSAAWGDVSEAHRVIEEAMRRARPGVTNA